jgi:hypothetical protein
VRTLIGDEARLITRYHLAKDLVGDGRLGCPRPEPGRAPHVWNFCLDGWPMGEVERSPLPPATR